jgi:DNA-binding CsgD family transcriptional regulator
MSTDSGRNGRSGWVLPARDVDGSAEREMTPGRRGQEPGCDGRVEAPHGPGSPRVRDLIDAVTTWEELARRPWDIALLIALDDGPADCAGACAVAVAWADGQLPDVNLPHTLADLVDAGLALRLAERGGEGLFVITSRGRQLVEAFEHAARRLDLLEQLRAFADSCVFHDRLHRLTAAEIRVLGLVARGRTDRQVAAALRMSRRAVEVHLSRILRTLGLSSRNALIARLTIESLGP